MLVRELHLTQRTPLGSTYLRSPRSVTSHPRPELGPPRFSEVLHRSIGCGGHDRPAAIHTVLRPENAWPARNLHLSLDSYAYLSTLAPVDHRWNPAGGLFFGR